MFPKIHISIERWRKNEEYGVYVSNQGNVKLIKNKKYLEPRIDSKGYCQVFTEKGAISIHRLVAYTWLGDKRNEQYTVDHINSNKRDNSVKNLRWMSADLNAAYGQFTKSEVVSEEDPLTAIERDEKLMKIMWDTSLNEKVRGNALRELFKNGKMRIRTDKGDIPDENSLLTMSHKLAGSMKLSQFCGRILKASASKTKYCNLTWYVEAKND